MSLTLAEVRSIFESLSDGLHDLRRREVLSEWEIAYLTAIARSEALTELNEKQLFYVERALRKVSADVVDRLSSVRT